MHDSYASYEAMGLDLGSIGLEPLIKRVLTCFEPAEFSVAVTCHGGSQWDIFADVDGYSCDNCVKQDLPGGEYIVYRCFTMAAEAEGGRVNLSKYCIHQNNTVQYNIILYGTL